MSKKTAYLIRYGAYGDHVHMTNVIRTLDEEGWHITLEYNLKGNQIHIANPRVDCLILNDPTPPETYKEAKTVNIPYGRHLFNLKSQYDKVVSFQCSLEDALIEGEDHPRYFWPLSWRRRKNAGTCYYDQSMKWAGFTAPRYMGHSGEIWFTAEEHETILANLNKKKDNFLIMYAWRGTMQQKATYQGIGNVFAAWLQKYPDTTIFTTGDPLCKNFEGFAPFTDKRFIHLAGRVPYRQAMNICRYMDLVITPETGLGIAAGAMGTPKIMLLTAASLTNIVGNDENDYSLQSPAYCSPCTRAIYNIDNCPTKANAGGEMHPLCVFFSERMVLTRMEEVYTQSIPRRWEPLGDIQKTISGKEVWR